MSLTLAEARARADLLSDVSYELAPRPDRHRGAPVPRDGPVRLRVAGGEHLPRAGARLRLTVDGARAGWAGVRRAADRARRGSAAANELVVEARIPYVTDGDGMHTFTDPADGERYVSAYCGDGRLPEGLPLLRPERPQGPGHPRGDRAGRLDGAGQRRPHDRAGRGRGRHLDASPPPRRSAAGDVRDVRRALGLGALGARRAAVRLARPAVAGAGARARRRRAAPDHRGLLRPLRADLRRALRLRLLRPGDGARPELGRDGDARLRHLPRRDAAPGPDDRG